MGEVSRIDIDYLVSNAASHPNFKFILKDASEETIRGALQEIGDNHRKKAVIAALRAQLNKLTGTESKPQLSFAAQLLACRLCRNARPTCDQCCKTCADTCNGSQLCYHDLPEKELVNRAHILRDEEESVRGIGKLEMTEVPVSEAERQDPALHMEMETLRAERTERQIVEVIQADREQRTAQAYEVAGRIQAFTFIEKVLTVSTLVQLQQIKESNVYKDLPNIGTWDKYCEYLGFSRQKVDTDLKNLAEFGEQFLLTVSSFGLGYREMRRLRQLQYDGESFQISDDGKTVIIEGEVIPLGEDAAPMVESALEKLLIKNKTLADRNRKLEKEFKAAVKEETHGLESEKTALLERVQKLEQYEPTAHDETWCEEQMTEVAEKCGEFSTACLQFIVDPRLDGDRAAQAAVLRYVDQAERYLHDLRSRFEKAFSTGV